MLKFSEIIGLPVINIIDGNRIGTVKDIIFISTTKEIAGLIIYIYKNVFSNRKVIIAKDIIRVGKSAVLIRDEENLIPLKQYFMKARFVKKYNDEIKEKQVYTDAGTKLGTIQDAIFDFETGKLAEFEISDGLIQDLIDGRKIMPVTESIYLEQGIVIVEAEKEYLLKDNHKGLKNILRKEGSK